MRFFDSLTHVTSGGSWLDDPRYDASGDLLVHRLDGAGIERACLVGIAHLADNAAIVGLTNRAPERFVPVAGFDPSTHDTASQLTDELEHLVSQGFAGIKLHPRFNDYDPLDERVFWTIDACARLGLVLHYCMLTRQKNRPTPHPADIADRLAVHSEDVRLVLVHAGGAHARELFEIGRMHRHVILDVAFTMMRYAGSSVDDDLRFMFEQLDQRMVVGSDSPEYEPAAVVDRFDELTGHLAPEKRDRIAWSNLDELYPGPYPMKTGG